MPPPVEVPPAAPPVEPPAPPVAVPPPVAALPLPPVLVPDPAVPPVPCEPPLELHPMAATTTDASTQVIRFILRSLGMIRCRLEQCMCHRDLSDFGNMSALPPRRIRGCAPVAEQLSEPPQGQGVEVSVYAAWTPHSKHRPCRDCGTGTLHGDAREWHTPHSAQIPNAPRHSWRCGRSCHGSKSWDDETAG